MKTLHIARCLLAAILFITAVQPVKAYVYSNPTADEFPILGWFSILPDEEQTPERYREMAEAGFNITFPHFSTLTQVRRALTAMDGTGIRLLATCGEIQSDPQNTLSYLRRHKLVVGYFIGDEPNVAGMTAYGQACANIRRHDQQKIVYGNLLPNYAKMADVGAESYRDYVQKYIEKVNTGLLSFDNYPIVKKGGTDVIRDGFFENLQIVHEEADRVGWPFWAFALATAHGSYPIPTLAHLRLQIYSDLAFGAQGIQYFTYWTPLGTQWDFHNAPIDENGNRTGVYDLIQRVNGVVQNLSWVFLGAHVKNVGFTANVPQGCYSYTKFPPEVVRLRCDQGLLVSELENGDKRFLVVVNHSLSTTKRVTLSAHEGRVLKVLETGETEAVKLESRVIDPGNMFVYQLLDEGDHVVQPSVRCPHIYAGDGRICVEGGEASVYTLGGELVGHTSDVLPIKSGFYVVKANGCSRRVFVR
ncbi:MAG: hypothetical protein K5945_10645 [Bacteroidaceae bacterium]|nr:hypothetical protein [Bacteroidaceae bacterium]